MFTKTRSQQQGCLNTEVQLQVSTIGAKMGGFNGEVVLEWDCLNRDEIHWCLWLKWLFLFIYKIYLYTVV